MTSDIMEQAVHHTLAANPLVGVRGHDIVDATRVLLGRVARHPGVLAQQYLSFAGELGRIATGRSKLAPDDKDKRFADAAWKENAGYRALVQVYLAWGNALNRLVDDAKLGKRDAERARFVVSLLVDALSPTNALAGNPGYVLKQVHGLFLDGSLFFNAFGAGEEWLRGNGGQWFLLKPGAGTSRRHRARSSTAVR